MLRRFWDRDSVVGNEMSDPLYTNFKLADRSVIKTGRLLTNDLLLDTLDEEDHKYNLLK